MKLSADQKEIARALAIGAPAVALVHYMSAANDMVATPNADNLASAQNARTLLFLTAAAAGVAYLAALR